MLELHKNKKLICGTCKWYNTPYRGKTCKEKRKINEFTHACIEYEKGKYNEDVLKMKRDPILRKIRRKIKAIRFDKNLELEIKILQKASEIKHFNHTFVEANKDMIRLSKRFATTQSARERINEIIIEITNLLNKTLYRMRSLVRSKILTEYSSFIETFRTADDKQNIVEYITPELTKIIDTAENILEIGELAIKNLDQGYWFLKAIKEIGEGIIERRIVEVSINRK